MKFFNKKDYGIIEKVFDNLPFNIDYIEIEENGTLNFNCYTKKLNFNFVVVVNSSSKFSNLYFEADNYGNSDLVMSDFQNELYFGDKEKELEKYNKENVITAISYFFLYNNESLYQYYIYKTQIIEYNKYKENINIDINKILEILKEKNSEFDTFPSWMGNCYAISNEIIDIFNIENKELVYGKYFGFVNDDSFFDKGINNHGWIEYKDGNRTIVIDPTRWVFENIEPYIYVNTKSIEYDRAGQRFLEIIKQEQGLKIPEYNENDNKANIDIKNIEIKNFIFNILLEGKYNEKELTVKTLFYIANLPISILEPFTKEIYTYLIEAGYKTLIPVDNIDMVFLKYR